MDVEQCPNCNSQNIKSGWADDNKGNAGEYYICGICEFCWDDEYDPDWENNQMREADYKKAQELKGQISVLTNELKKMKSFAALYDQKHKESPLLLSPYISARGLGYFDLTKEVCELALSKSIENAQSKLNNTKKSFNEL